MLTAGHVGARHGAVLTITASELQPGITGLKDVGEKGPQAEMLRSFKFEREEAAAPAPAPPVPAAPPPPFGAKTKAVPKPPAPPAPPAPKIAPPKP